MLKCRDIAEKASHYLEGDYPWHEKLSWRMHLFMCGSCRRFIHQLKLTITASTGLIERNTDQEEAVKTANTVRDVCKHNHKQQ